MLGYCTNAKGYRVILQNDDGTYYVAQSRDVVFDETIVGMQVLSKKRARDNDIDADDVTPGSTGVPPPAPPVRGRTRVGRAVKAPERLGDYHVYYTLSGEEVICFYTEDADAIVEPLTLEQALESPQQEDWIKALNAEYASLTANQTWTLVKKPPELTLSLVSGCLRSNAMQQDRSSASSADTSYKVSSRSTE
jgi:hypothetical protein